MRFGFRVGAEDATIKYQRARERRAANDLEGALGALTIGLEIDPDHSDCLNLFGCLLVEQGRTEEAITHLEAAVGSAPGNGIFKADFAAALFALGRTQDAETMYRSALLLLPDDASINYALGKLLNRCGRSEDAAIHFRLAANARPSDTQILFDLANALSDERLLDEAISIYEKVLILNPSSSSAYNNLGVAFGKIEAPTKSGDAFKAAIEIDPTFPEAKSNLANLLMSDGRYDEAERLLAEAIAAKPHFAEAHNNLGNLLRICGRLSEAEYHCIQALTLRPGYSSALVNLGNALRELGRFDEALKYYEDTLRIEPEYCEALNNLGSLLFDLGRPVEGIERFRAAIKLQPNYVDAHSNLGLALLLLGEFEEGWLEYEWRWLQGRHRSFLSEYSQPRWEGEELGSRRLLVRSEQGFGDTLQFCRLVPGLGGNQVIFEVQPPLVPLLKCLPGVEVVAQGEPLPPFDLQCPLLSLPRILGLSLETIPAAVPYLRADPGKVDRWRQRLAPLPGLRVGLVWAGNADMGADNRRSIPLARLARLAEVGGVSFVSLQKGPAANQIPPPAMVLHDWTSELTDFAATAALVEALDLIIGVDTAVIHLAGALAKPVWLLNRFDRCWRWLLDRDDSPWYPTLRQFRQPQPGDWEAVVARVCEALQRQQLSPY